MEKVIHIQHIMLQEHVFISGITIYSAFVQNAHKPFQIFL